jgi:hypothetical protein
VNCGSLFNARESAIAKRSLSISRMARRLPFAPTTTILGRHRLAAIALALFNGVAANFVPDLRGRSHLQIDESHVCDANAETRKFPSFNCCRRSVVCICEAGSHDVRTGVLGHRHRMRDTRCPQRFFTRYLKASVFHVTSAIWTIFACRTEVSLAIRRCSECQLRPFSSRWQKGGGCVKIDYGR